MGLLLRPGRSGGCRREDGKEGTGRRERRNGRREGRWKEEERKGRVIKMDGYIEKIFKETLPGGWKGRNCGLLCWWLVLVLLVVVTVVFF